MNDFPVYSIYGTPVAVKLPDSPLSLAREDVTVDDYINHLCVWNPALQDWTNINNVCAVGSLGRGYTLEFSDRKYEYRPMGYDTPIDPKFAQWRMRYRDLCRALHQQDAVIAQMHQILAWCKNDNVTYQETLDTSSFAITTRDQFDLHFSIASTTDAKTHMPTSMQQSKVLDKLKLIRDTYNADWYDLIYVHIIDHITQQTIDTGPLAYIDLCDIDPDRQPKTQPITICSINRDDQGSRYHFIIDSLNVGVMDYLSKMVSKSVCITRNVKELVLLFRNLNPYTDDLPVASDS